MRKIHLLSLAIIISLAAFGQEKLSPQKIYAFPAFAVQKPVLLDSANLSDKKYSDEKLLANAVSFPTHDRFNIELLPDTAGYFHLEKPKSGYVFHLLSVNLNADGYGKGKLTVTSPSMFELYIDNDSRGSKTKLNDSLKNAGSVDANLSGFTNNSRIVIKLLSAATDKVEPTVKIELKPDTAATTPQFAFNNVDKRRITINDIIEGKRVGGSSISPSGRFVMLYLSETLSGGKRNSSIEIYDTKQKKTVFSEPSNRSQLQWMPKSDLLTYVADSENGRTMYTLDPLTSQTRIIAENLPKENFSMAPDEKSMFYSMKETKNFTDPKGLRRLMAPDDRQSNYRDRYFIYRYFFDSGLSQQLTYGKETASINDVNEDVTHLLFSTSQEDLTERPFRKGSMYLLNLQSMEIDTIWRHESFANSAQFSPDGKKLLINGAPEAFNGIGLNIKEGQIANSYDYQSYLMDLVTKKVEPLTKNFNPSINSQKWNAADNFIYLRAEDGDRVNVFRYSPKTKKFEKLPLKEDVIRSFDISDNGLYATYSGVSVSNSNRVYILNLKTLTSTLVSDPFAERLNKIQLGDVIDWNFKSSFGDEIVGRYYLPPNFDPKKKYPLIVYYYGGTSPTSRIFESTYPFHVYAAQDFVLYTLQPSGTTGFGQEFSARHVNAWGKQTADEIIEGTRKFVAEHSFVDGTKIGNIGASYGGFMTQYLITQTHIFGAAVSHAGISNIASYWGEGYWGYSYSSAASAGSYPWNNPDLYFKQSPLFQADKIKTPLLLLHGTADTNVPIGESIQMYTALKLLGKEVEFIQVEGENHAIYDYEKRIAWNNAIYAWFTKWLKGDSRWWDSMYGEK